MLSRFCRAVFSSCELFSHQITRESPPVTHRSAVFLCVQPCLGLLFVSDLWSLTVLLLCFRLAFALRLICTVCSSGVSSASPVSSRQGFSFSPKCTTATSTTKVCPVPYLVWDLFFCVCPSGFESNGRVPISCPFAIFAGGICLDILKGTALFPSFPPSACRLVLVSCCAACCVWFLDSRGNAFSDNWSPALTISKGMHCPTSRFLACSNVTCFALF